MRLWYFQEEMVRRSFDAHDTSGGGGFISPPDLEKLLQELDMKLPPATVTELGANGIILWQDFWQVKWSAVGQCFDMCFTNFTKFLAPIVGIHRSGTLPNDGPRGQVVLWLRL